PVLLNDNGASEDIGRGCRQTQQDAEENRVHVGWGMIPVLGSRFSVLSYAAGRIEVISPFRILPSSEALSNTCCARSSVRYCKRCDKITCVSTSTRAPRARPRKRRTRPARTAPVLGQCS